MMQDPYLQENGKVLKNRGGLKTREALYKFERMTTDYRNEELLMSPIIGDFDFAHLKAIHFYLFQDVYDWAGQVRTVDIAKSNLFCRVMYIDTQAEQIFGGLASENYLKNIEYQRFIRRISFYYAEINALHPFREGNGRSAREFIRELALNAGYVIDWTKTTKEEIIEASIASFGCNYTKMEALMEKCVSSLEVR